MPPIPPLTCPPAVRALMELFAAHGERAYPVGGCVRDTLMGLPPHDWDVAVTTTPERTMELCRAAGYAVVPTGIKHGTVTVLVGEQKPRMPVECTTCRTEGGYSDGRHPDAVSFTGRIEDDLSRRDFTVNAMALDTAPDGTLCILDLFGGQADLAGKILRCVGDPDTRFGEDALRLLRAIRFAVRLDFEIEPATYAAIRRGAAGLARISRERVASELRQILTGRNPDRGVALLIDSGIMPYILGGVRIALPTDTRLIDLPADYPTRLAALLWHADFETAHNALVSLKPSGEESHAAMTLLDDRAPLDSAAPIDMAAARRLRHRYGELAFLRQILRAAYAPTAADRAAEERLAEMIEASAAAREPVTAAELAIGGRELIALGMPAGPSVGKTVACLLDAVLDDPARNTREELAALVKKMLAEGE